MRFLASNVLRAHFGLLYVLGISLACPPNVGAQSPPAQTQAQPGAALPTVQALRVIPLAGEGSANDLERKIMAPVVVEVLDRESNPVEGAQVVFRFPLTGPGATFTNGQLSQTTRSNADGQASATGWTANTSLGSFQVHVTASRGNEFGQAVISMTNATRILGTENVAHKSRWSSKWTKIGVAAGAAAVVAAIVISRRGGSSTPTTTTTPSSTTVTITGIPGIPSIGAP